MASRSRQLKRSSSEPAATDPESSIDLAGKRQKHYHPRPSATKLATQPNVKADPSTDFGTREEGYDTTGIQQDHSPDNAKSREVRLPRDSVHGPIVPASAPTNYDLTPLGYITKKPPQTVQSSRTPGGGSSTAGLGQSMCMRLASEGGPADLSCLPGIQPSGDLEPCYSTAALSSVDPRLARANGDKLYAEYLEQHAACLRKGRGGPCLLGWTYDEKTTLFHSCDKCSNSSASHAQCRPACHPDGPLCHHIPYNIYKANPPIYYPPRHKFMCDNCPYPQKRHDLCRTDRMDGYCIFNDLDESNEAWEEYNKERLVRYVQHKDGTVTPALVDDFGNEHVKVAGMLYAGEIVDETFGRQP